MPLTKNTPKQQSKPLRFDLLFLFSVKAGRVIAARIATRPSILFSVKASLKNTVPQRALQSIVPEFENIDKVEIREEDIEVTAHRSSGAGGQHINKTDSAIRILHKPTGIVVGCQTERSQLQNKETAMKMLKAKLMEIKLRERLDTIEDIQGNKTNIEWGAQICSYVFMPYTLAKDTRTGFEDGNISAVMDGEIDGFINAYLKMNAK